MTSEQKKEIKRMRQQEVGYTAIAARLGLSKETVKSFCKRNNIGGIRAEQVKDGCLQCGKPIMQIPKRKPKKFCCDECRKLWWKDHPDRVVQKAVYSYVCPHCGKDFTAYGNSRRKYCSHECYVSARFGGGAAV